LLNISKPNFFTLLQHCCKSDHFCHFSPKIPKPDKNPQTRQKSPNPPKIPNKNLSQKSQKIRTKNPRESAPKIPTKIPKIPPKIPNQNNIQIFIKFSWGRDVRDFLPFFKWSYIYTYIPYNIQDQLFFCIYSVNDVPYHLTH
jgi:hypothetical protein